MASFPCPRVDILNSLVVMYHTLCACYNWNLHMTGGQTGYTASAAPAKPVYTTSRVGSLPRFKPHRWDASHSCYGGYFSSQPISFPLDPTLHPVLPGS